MRQRLRAFRAKVTAILDREAKVRDLVKASLPLWASVVLACGAGLGALSARSAQREDDLADTRIASCQARNSAQEAARRDNRAILDGLRAPFPEALTLIDDLAEAQSRPSDVDTDCNGDGLLTSADYGDDIAPLDLPAPVRGG